MRISPKLLKQEAARKLDSLNCSPRKTLLLYAAVAFGLSLLSSLLSMFLNAQIDQQGGLDSLETTAFLESVSSIVNLVLTFALPIWSLGLVSVALGFAQGENVGSKGLLAGFSRPFRGIGLYLLTTLTYAAASAIMVYVGIFLMVPFAETPELDAILAPFVAQLEQNPNLLQDSAFLETLPWADILSCLWVPMLIIGILAALLSLFLSYVLRLAPYYLMDDPEMSPIRAMWKSFLAVIRNLGGFIKLDLSYWWYYLPTLAVDALLLAVLAPSMLGGQPAEERFVVFLQFVSFLVACLLYWWKGPKVETTYALAYQTVKE